MAGKNKKEILLGNEAIVRGALEAGVEFVSAYPGTPSSEISGVFSEVAKDYNVYFEYSTNEKVALEASIGASFSGLKCLVAMKNFGVNVCSDSLGPFMYTGSKGPCVLAVADDPSCWSSAQSEQNSRAYACLFHIPILEPADAQEAKDFIKLAFKISKNYKIPVMVRITTRVAHQRMPVVLEDIKKRPKPAVGNFIKDVERFVTMPPRVLEMKQELFDKIRKIKKEVSEKDSNINAIINNNPRAKIGLIASGVSYLYCQEALRELGLELPILKIGFFYPLPKEKIKNFIKNLDKVLVAEELEPFIQREVERFAKSVNPKLEIFGKDLMPAIGELNAEKVAFALAKVAGKKYKISLKQELKLPKRYPRLCQGCPYWFVFSTLKRVAPKNTVFGGDIGCYMLAGLPPHNIQDYLFSMGSSLGIAHGIRKVSKDKVIALIGDGTFFHAGIPALINAVFNKSNPLIIILDNRITAMTGHQTNPGLGITGMGEETAKIKIEDIVKACGVENIAVVDPIDIKKLESVIKEFLDKKEVSVIIARRICAFWEKRIAKKSR